MSDAPTQNQATVVINRGPLVGPVLSRVVGMLAARAQCPIDRLDDALLLADAVAAHGAAYGTNGRIGVDVHAHEGTLELRVGPLRPQGARQLVAEAELPGVGNVLERVADQLEPVAGDEGEHLFIRMGFGGTGHAT